MVFVRINKYSDITIQFGT